MDKKLKGIKEAVDEASQYDIDDCLEVLRKKMNEMGYKFSKGKRGQVQSYEEALRHSWDIRENKKRLSSLSIENDNDYFPGTKLEIDDKTYYIHGLVHGNSRFALPTEEIKKSVQRYVGKGHKPKYGEVVFFEHGLDNPMIFDFNVGTDFDDNRFVNSMDEWDFVRWCGKEDEKLYGMLSRNNYKKRYRILKSALKNLSYMPRVKEVHLRSDGLKEPLMMAYIRASERKRPKYVPGERNVAKKYIEDRSKIMAERMFKRKANEIHAIVGYVHEDQIAYFLKKMHGE
ncbi:MAG: hypothetical protein HZB68_03615 [Candidatus Aenigmarchaeota archaeon]|nr:hypothetical protein [Candidatus Aenigmarchaeota archaeon]